MDKEEQKEEDFQTELAEITAIVLNVNDKTIELTLTEAKQLMRILNETFEFTTSLSRKPTIFSGGMNANVYIPHRAYPPR